MTAATTIRRVPMDPNTAKKLASTSNTAARKISERDQLIAIAFRSGASMREIARAVGMTHPGVRAILIRDECRASSRNVRWLHRQEGWKVNDIYEIEFESVSATRYPHLYDWRTERAKKGLTPDDLKGVVWEKASRRSDKDSIYSQFNGLKQLINEGELIRNVRVYKVNCERELKEETSVLRPGAGRVLTYRVNNVPREHATIDAEGYAIAAQAHATLAVSLRLGAMVDGSGVVRRPPRPAAAPPSLLDCLGLLLDELECSTPVDAAGRPNGDTECRTHGLPFADGLCPMERGRRVHDEFRAP